MAKNGSETSRYANPDSVHNVAAIRQMFPFEGLIEEIELRGICLEQLKRIRLYAHTCSHHWWDHFPTETSATAGEMLTTEILNFQHLGAWLVKPATKEHQCSFSELFPRQKVSPQWFVSHAWTQRFVDFMACVQSHIAARSLTEATPYWVCAFAQRLHAASGEGAAAKISEGLRTALSASKRLMVCGDGAFDRLWCCYERFLAVQSGCSHTDVVLKRGEVLVDGIPDTDLFMTEDAGAGAAPPRPKADLSLLLRGLETQVELTAAAQDADRRFILNMFADTDIQLPPPDVAESYLTANGMLRARWASLLWRALLEDQGQVPDLAKHVAASRSRTLALNFGSCDAFDDRALMEVAEAFHEDLREVRLNFSRCGSLSNRSFEAFLERLPRQLESLEIDLRRTAASPETVANILAVLPAEAQLSLGISAQALTAPPAAAPQLRVLRLDLQGSFDLRVIAAWLPGSLQSLSLQISEAPLAAEDLGSFLLSLPRSIEHLALSAVGAAAGWAALAAAVRAASRRLDVRFGPPSPLDDAGVAAAGALLEEGLQELHLDLVGTSCTTGALQSVAAHCTPSLQHVDVAVAKHRIKSLPQLTLWRPSEDNEVLVAGRAVANAIKELLPDPQLPAAEVYDMKIMSRVDFASCLEASGEKE